MAHRVMCVRLHKLKKTEFVIVDYDKNTCSAKSKCEEHCGFQKSEA